MVRTLHKKYLSGTLEREFGRLVKDVGQICPARRAMDLRDVPKLHHEVPSFVTKFPASSRSVQIRHEVSKLHDRCELDPIGSKTLQSCKSVRRHFKHERYALHYQPGKPQYAPPWFCRCCIQDDYAVLIRRELVLRYQRPFGCMIAGPCAPAVLT
jgi:hypothetical protein